MSRDPVIMSSSKNSRGPDWIDLPGELIAVIAKLITSIQDYLCFRAVCKSWRSAATFDNFDSAITQLPWLVFMSTDQKLSENPDCKKEIILLDIFDTSNNNNNRCLKGNYKLRTKFFSCSGWILGVTEDTVELQLIHAIHGRTLDLPGLDTIPGN